MIPLRSAAESERTLARVAFGHERWHRPYDYGRSEARPPSGCERGRASGCSRARSSPRARADRRGRSPTTHVIRTGRRQDLARCTAGRLARKLFGEWLGRSPGCVPSWRPQALLWSRVWLAAGGLLEGLRLKVPLPSTSTRALGGLPADVRSLAHRSDVSLVAR
jgi:hypothetical protein